MHATASLPRCGRKSQEAEACHQNAAYVVCAQQSKVCDHPNLLQTHSAVIQQHLAADSVMLLDSHAMSCCAEAGVIQKTCIQEAESSSLKAICYSSRVIAMRAKLSKVVI